jgi:hypothetical protein
MKRHPEGTKCPHNERCKYHPKASWQFRGPVCNLEHNNVMPMCKWKSNCNKHPALSNITEENVCSLSHPRKYNGEYILPRCPKDLECPGHPFWKPEIKKNSKNKKNTWEQCKFKHSKAVGANSNGSLYGYSNNNLSSYF